MHTEKFLSAISHRSFSHFYYFKKPLDLHLLAEEEIKTVEGIKLKLLYKFQVALTITMQMEQGYSRNLHTVSSLV